MTAEEDGYRRIAAQMTPKEKEQRLVARTRTVERIKNEDADN